MQSATEKSGGSTEGRVSFPPTQWSVVAKAKQWDSPDVDIALERLCSVYWSPLYSYIRRKGYDATEAKDLTQEFIARFLEKNWLRHHVDRRAKFRSFLLTFLEHFLSDYRAHINAQKRGGGKFVISLEAIETEERSVIEPSTDLSPDQLYDRSWVHVLLKLASDRIEEEYRGRKQERLFAELCQIAPGEHGDRNYSEISASLGMSQEAFKSAVFRHRVRLGELVREVIAETVSDPDQVEEEVQSLLQAFS